MRVLFHTSGWLTHLYMVAPLAQAFRLAGHEVRVAGPEMGRPAVLGAGLPFVETGHDVDFLRLRQVLLPHEARVEAERPVEAEADPASFAAELEQLYEVDEVVTAMREIAFSASPGLVAFASAWRPQLVITDGMSLAGLVAARVISAPAVWFQMSPSMIGPDGEPLLHSVPGYHEHFAEYGVELDGDAFAMTVDPCPPSIQPPAPAERTPMRWVPYNGPGSMPAWLLEPPARRRVCLTWGTSSVWSAGRRHFLIPDVLAALAELDVEVVVTLGKGQSEMLTGVPGEVRVVESLPLHFLMPSCDLLIHQGGSSSMLTGAYYGVPQLAIPYLPEQVVDARAHAASGASRWLFGTDEADRDSIHAAAAALLHDPQTRDAADRLEREIAAQPAPADTVRTLERLATRVLEEAS